MDCTLAYPVTMTADQLRKESMTRTLVRMVESLETIFVGVNVGMLEDLGFPLAIHDYMKEHEAAPFNADTAEHVLPTGVAWPDDEITEPEGVHNRHD